MPPSTPRLGDLERTVMDCLWRQAEGATVRDVHDELAADRPIAYTTVLTVLDRLARKGVVTRTREGRAWHYRATHTAQSMTAQAIRAHFDELGADDRKTAMLHFLGGASPEELAAVRAALQELEAGLDSAPTTRRRAGRSGPGAEHDPLGT